MRMHFFRGASLPVLLLLAASLVPSSALALPLSCEALKSLPLAHTSITSAEVVAAGAFKSPGGGMNGPPGDFSGLPVFCRVEGSVRPTADSDIRFEVWLPERSWNGKFVQTGNGGAAGSIVHSSLIEPLSRGFAVANTDTGHQGEGGDYSWAVSHPEKVTDYAYRAVHELTVAGKAITAARYGRQPEKSYFNGCSTGGRQGLKEAQLFPEDYDAIIAGAPASNWSALMSMSVLIQRNLTGPQGLDVGKLALLREGAISACDAPDGVSDRVITEPRRCGFNPASLQCKGGESGQCLSAAEVAAAQRIYKGVVTKEGKTRMPGTGPASELLWAAYASPQFGIGTNYFRNLVMRDPKWDPTQFDVDTDLARAERIDNGAIAAMSPDLGRFFARGGKLITYHGTTDGLISYVNSVNYFESVIARLGKATVKKSARLYVIPGMDHCSGGEGAHSIDWLGGLDAWATSGVPPESLPSLHPAIAPPGMPGMPAPPASKPFERPACPYPQVARYKGAGDTTQAASFECRTPQ